jgi:ABC-2 type transport system ATP-binding protein
MNTSSIEEIQGYLKHNDYSLAIRRTLDTCLDTGNDALINDAINWSVNYHQHVAATDVKEMPATFFETAQTILATANDYHKNTPATKQPLLQAKKISKKYKKGTFSLKPIDVTLHTGEVLGVVGENGNGKTTLLRSLAGQLAIDEGCIDYKQLQQPDYYAIKNHIAFIPQRIPKWYGMLQDNLHFSAALNGVIGQKNNLMVRFMLERLGLTNFAHLNWNQISSGYRTRFELARILLQKPRLLILDEPLANLDINAQQTILTDLIFMAKGLHNPMGIILSSQQLHEVEKVADTVLFIKQGQCLYSSDDKATQITSTAIEFETMASREKIMAIFNADEIELQYNGGFYTLISTIHTPQTIINKMIIAGLPITYFRDITYSTKRFF